MSSSKVFLCDLCIILLFGFSIVLSEDSKSTTSVTQPEANCACGGFPSMNPEVGDVPLLCQTPGLVIKCDEEGEATCKKLCTALATATKAKGPEILCNKLKNANELKLSAFFKACDKPWSYANMTADEPLCCDDSKMKICASTEKANTTSAVDAKVIM